MLDKTRARVGFFVAAVLALLLTTVAEAARLVPEKTNIAVGEEISVKVTKKPLIAVITGWKASGALELVSSVDDTARVRGVRPGIGTVGMRLNGNPQSIEITVTAAPVPTVKGLSEPDWGESGPALQRLSYDQRQMANLLRQANNALAAGTPAHEVARQFYAELAKLGLKEPLVELNRLKTRLLELGLADAALGKRFAAGGTPVERALLVYRRDLTLEAIRAAVAEVGRRFGGDTGTVFLAKIGKWAVQDPDQFVLAGDIDFSFVGARPEVILALRDIYAAEMKKRSGGLDMVGIDSLATAHGFAEHYVYVGIQGRKFADDAMRGMAEGVERIDFRDPEATGTSRAEAVHGEQALYEVVIEETARRYRESGRLDASRNELEAIDRAWSDRTRQTVEPFLSMEMARHLDKDIIQKADVFAAIDIIKKGAKYLRRSNDQTKSDLKIPATDPALAKFVRDVDEMAKDKTVTADALVKFIDAELKKLGVEGFTMRIIDGKAVLEATPDGVQGFLARVKDTIWKNVAAGMDVRIRALTDALNGRPPSSGDPDDMRPERLADTLRMLAEGLKVMRDEHADIPRDIAAKASALATLVESYGSQRRYALPAEEIERIRELLRESLANDDALRLQVGVLVSRIDQWLVKYYERLSAKLPAAQRLSMLDAKIDALNSVLDALDNTVLDALRSKGVLELEINPILTKDGKPRVHTKTFPRLAAINQRLNESVLGRIGNNTAFKAFNLAQEGNAYYEALIQAPNPSEAFSNLATEIFRRRVPGGGAVEAFVMENYARMGIEVVYTIFPPLAVPKGVYGMATALYESGRHAWWHSELETLIDSLYEQAEFGHDSRRPGYYPLTHVTYKGVRYSRQGLEQGKSFILDPDVDVTLSNNLRASDPFLSLMAELENHPAAGERVRSHFRTQAEKRWIELKREFVAHMIERLEQRHAAEVADLTGQLPGIYTELMAIADQLEIRERILEKMDAEWDSSNLKAFWIWLKNVGRQAAWGGTLAESERDKAAAILMRYRDAYRSVLAHRERTETQIARILTEQGVGRRDVLQHRQRLLTGIVFLTGEDARDKQIAAQWAATPERIVNKVRSELSSIKSSYIGKTALDSDFDRHTLGEVFFEDIWIEALRTMKVPVIAAASYQRAAEERKQRRAELIKAYRTHYAGLAASGQGTEEAPKKPGVKDKSEQAGKDKPGQDKVASGAQTGTVPDKTTGSAAAGAGASTRVPTDLSKVVCANPTGTFPASPFNRLQLRYGISGVCVGPAKDREGFTHSRNLEILGVTGSNITVSGSVAPYEAACYSWAGSFWFQTEVSLTVADKTVSFSSPKPCEKPSKEMYKVQQPAHSFNLSLPVPVDKAEIPVSISIRQTYVNPRFGDRGVVVSATGTHVRPVIGSFPDGGEDGTPPPPELLASLEGSQGALQLGQTTTLVVKVEGGKPPYAYAWNGAAGEGASARFRARKPGEHAVTVSVSDSAGQSAKAEAKIKVEAPKLTLSVLPNQPVYGSRARLTLTGMPAAEAGQPRYRYIWQASPGLGFEPATSTDNVTTVTFDRMGQVRVWCELQVEDEGRWATLAETERQTVNVIAPKFVLRFTPPNGQGRVGEEVRAQLVATPEVPAHLIDYRWIEPVARMEYSHNADEVGIKVKDAKPMSIEVLARVPYHGDEIARITGTYTGRAYEVKIGEPRGQGPQPQVWVCDTQLGAARGCGMKELPRGQFATFQDIYLRAEVTPEPPVARYRWTVEPSGSCGLPGSGRELKINCSNTGSYTVRLQVLDAEGLLLGQAERNVMVAVSDSEIRQAPKSKQAFEKMQQAKQLAGNGQLDEAIALAGTAVSLDPNNTEARELGKRWGEEREGVRRHLERAQQALQANRLDEAQREIDAAKRLNPRYEPVREAETRIAEARRRTTTAAAHTNAAPRSQPINLAGVGGRLGTPRTVKGVLIDDSSWIRFKSTDENRRSLDIPLPAPTMAAAVAIVSNLDDATYLEQGKTIARILVDKDSGDETLDIQAGVHSSEWNYGVGPKHKRVDSADIGDNRFLVVLPLSRPGLVRRLRIEYVETHAPKWAGHAPGFVLRGISLVDDTRGLTLTPSVGEMGTPSAADGGTTIDISGKWRTSEGEMTLSQSGRAVTGRYTNDNGEIVGELIGNVLEGWWIENSSNQRCATPRNGRYYWGRIRFTFSGNRFTGSWSYCDSPVPSQINWTGERIGAAPAAGSRPAVSSAPAAGYLRLEACVDGSDWIRIDNGRLTHEHRAFQQIGSHPSCPASHQVAGGGFLVDGQVVSLKQLPWPVSIAGIGRIEVERGRGAVHMDGPNRILIDDDGLGGPSVYVIRLYPIGPIGGTVVSAPGGRDYTAPTQTTLAPGEFVNPQVDGVALDICREWGANCGKPAADAFCQSQGYSHSLSHREQHDTPPTRVISSGQLCDQSFCDRIIWIQCAGTTPTASALPRIAEFSWQGMDEDRVGEWGHGKPNGVRDGRFRLVLEAPGRYSIASLSVWSANEKGEKAGGQIWHTRNAGYWMLGVFRDDHQLNPSHVPSLGEFNGRVLLDLYANNSGWFNPGQWFLLEVEGGDGKVLRQTLRLGEVVPGGRDYTYQERSLTPTSPPATSKPANSGDSQSLEEAARQLKDAVKELKNLFKW